MVFQNACFFNDKLNVNNKEKQKVAKNHMRFLHAKHIQIFKVILFKPKKTKKIYSIICQHFTIKSQVLTWVSSLTYLLHN